MFRSVIRAYARAFSGLPREVWLVCAVLLINRCGTMVLPFLSLYLTGQRGISVTQAGTLLSLYGVGSLIGSYLGGWLSDEIGARRTQQLSLVTGGISMLAFTQLRELPAIAGGVLVMSIAVESFRPAAMTALTQAAPQHLQARAFALMRQAANLGMGIAPAVGGYLALHEYNWLFSADAVTCWLAAVALWVFRPKDKRPTAGTTGNAATARGPHRDGPFLALMLFMLVAAVVLFQLFSTVPLYFRQAYQFREDMIGLMFGLNALLVLMFEMILVHWAERRDRMACIGVGAALLCVGLGLMPFGSSVPFVAMTVAVWSLGEMLSLPLVGAVVSERANPASRGRYMGMFSLAHAGAFMLAPLAGTFVFEHYGPDFVWYVTFAMGLPLFFAAMALRGPLGLTRSALSSNRRAP